MKKKTYAGAGIALFVAALASFAYTQGPLAPVGVQTAPVTNSDVSFSVFGIGTVEARYAYTIGPTQAGRVRAVFVDHGDKVQPGQLLAEMDPVDLGERLRGAGSALQRAQQGVLIAAAQVREAQSRHQLAAANAGRYTDLARRHFVSYEMADNRSNEANIAQAAMEAAQAGLAAAQKDVERAQEDRIAIERQIDNLKLKAPIAGLVIAREAEPGTTVVAGQAVLRLIDPRSVWVRARIDQSRAAGVVPGLAAEVTLRSNPARRLEGRVARVEIQGDAVTEEKVIAVELSTAVPESIGELAEVTIHLNKRPHVPVVPSAAIKRLGGEQGVWQVVDGVSRFRPVRTGAQTLDGATEVVEGIAASDAVVVYSTAPLKEGARVRVRNAS